MATLAAIFCLVVTLVVFGLILHALDRIKVLENYAGAQELRLRQRESQVEPVGNPWPVKPEAGV